MKILSQTALQYTTTLFLLTGFSFSSAVAQGAYPTETQITNEKSGTRLNNVYSPNLLYQNINGVKTLVMYFGGWYQTDPSVSPQDAIYRAVCSSPTSCGPAQMVIDPRKSNIGTAGLLNDPTIVQIHSSSQDYYIMYMTGVSSNDPKAGFTASNNWIYYSTSFVNDGVNWSVPKVIFTNAWLPSATVDSRGHVLLTANSNGATSSLPYLFQVDLNTSGTNNIGLKPIQTNSGQLYKNVDVVYRSAYNFFQITGENSSTGQIDYLDSADGVNWTLRNTNVAPNGITPGVHPDSSCWIYYGKIPAQLQSNIFFKSWC